MQSSRLHTDRLLTVCLLARGGLFIHRRARVHPLEGCIQIGGWVHPDGMGASRWGMSTSRGCIQWGRDASRREGVHPECTLPPVNRMAHACENITFPRTPYAVGNKSLKYQTFGCRLSVASTTTTGIGPCSLPVLPVCLDVSKWCCQNLPGFST